MKIKTPVTVVSIILGSALLALGQQAADNSIPQPESQDEIAARMGITFVDLTTFKVVGPRKDYPQDEGINSPEECRKRQLGVMQILNPVEYGKLFPLVPEEEAAINESIFQIEHNDEYAAEIRAGKTQQELEEDAALVAAIGALVIPSFESPLPPPEPMPAPVGNGGPPVEPTIPN